MKFEGIALSVDKMKQVMIRLSKSGEQMSHQKNEIVGILSNLSAVAEENATGTEEVSASIDERTRSITKILTNSENLSKLAEVLRHSVEKFKL